MNKIIRIVPILVGIFVLIIGFIYAATDPTGPSSITRGTNSRNPVRFPGTIEALAGNVTELNITSLTQTQTWQGYYGNITGTIVLDDAQNWTMYSWELSEPQGEIYASNKTTVTWANVKCINYTGNMSEDNIGNLTRLETAFGLTSDDVDGFNETFKNGTLSDGSSLHPRVYVGDVTIEAGTCPATDLYEGDLSVGINFVEILLTDNESLIFTAIIENDQEGNDTEVPGYNNATMDFQLLVADDGHNANTAITNYYFFVELE